MEVFGGKKCGDSKYRLKSEFFGGGQCMVFFQQSKNSKEDMFLKIIVRHVEYRVRIYTTSRYHALTRFGSGKLVREITGCKLPSLHPVTWTRDLLAADMCSQEEEALIICGVWSLWSGQNARRHGRTSWNPGAAVRHIADMVQELVCLDSKGEPSPRVPGKWMRPQELWVKVNSDASFVPPSRIGAGRVVIRNLDD